MPTVRSIATSDGEPVAPDRCETMAEVREGIDTIDRELVALLARRQRYIDAAARIKPSAGTIRDQARVEDVVAKVLMTAERAGLSRDIAEPVWRELIEQSIAHEHRTFDRLKGDETA